MAHLILRGWWVECCFCFRDRNFSPGAGLQIAYHERAVLNAPQPDHFMPQCFEEPPDLPVLSLRQCHVEMRFSS